MSAELRNVIVGAILCVAGAVLLDWNVKITGGTALILGVLGIIVGPILAQFDEPKDKQ